MRNILIVFLDRADSRYLGFWNAVDERLRAEGYRLVMLSTELFEGSSFDIYPIPYMDQVVGRRKSSLPEDVLWPLVEMERNGGRTDGNGYEGRLGAIEQYLGAIFDAYDPALATTWCSYPSLCAFVETFARSRGVRTVSLERGLVSDTVMLEPEGIIGLSRPPDETAGSDDAYPVEEYVRWYYGSKSDKWPQQGNVASREELEGLCGRKVEGRLFFFPGTNDHDSGAFHPRSDEIYSGLVRDSYEAAVQAAARLGRDDHILFKPHPRDRRFPSRRAELEKLDNVTVVRDLNVFDAIRHADCVLVVTTTLIIDAFMMERPVIRFGNSFFDHFGFPGKVEQWEAFEAMLDNPLADLVDAGATKRLIAYANNHYLYGMAGQYYKKGPGELARDLAGYAEGGSDAAPGMLAKARIRLLGKMTIRNRLTDLIWP